MAASSSPKGTVPEKQGVSKDVKTEAASASGTKASEVIEVARQEFQREDEPEAKVSDDLDDSVLEDLKQEAKVPYNRFKEINEKAKRVEREKAELERKYQDDLRRAQEDAERRALERAKKEAEEAQDFGDPMERKTRHLEETVQQLSNELKSLRGETSQQRLERQLETLKREYPDADELEVLGWKKSRPDSDLEELMAASQKKLQERTDKKIKALLEQKKQRAKAAIPTRESGLRLKDDEKPKSVKEAHGLLRKILSGA